MLQKGTKAPYFEGHDENGNLVKLTDFAGKKLVLYFYPKDSTPGCTAEACDLRDNYERFLALDYNVLGVSRDRAAMAEAKTHHRRDRNGRRFLALLFTCAALTVTAQQGGVRPIDGLAHRILGNFDTNFIFVCQPDTIDFFQIEPVREKKEPRFVGDNIFRKNWFYAMGLW